MDLFSNAETIKLEEDIKRYAKAYYEGNAIISDAEFDALVDRLRELNPTSSVLHTPRMGICSNRSKSKTQISISEKS